MAGEAVTYSSICHAVADAFRQTPSPYDKILVQAFDQVTETIPQVPCIRVLPEMGATAEGIERDASTFGPEAVRVTKFTLHANGYARKRSNLAEDLAAQLALIDAMDAELCKQNQAPYFGVAGVQALHWLWERVTWETTEEPKSYYVGVDFTIELWVF